MVIIVKLTTACNLKCVYCSEGNKEAAFLPMELLKKAIAEIPELLEATKQTKINILWHGGEPLLVGIEYLREAMHYAQEVLKDYELSFSLQSNGTLIDDSWISLFKEYKVSLGISLDGYEQLHDENRVYANGKPSFKYVLNKISLLQKENLKFGTLMVLNTQNEIDVDKLFEVLDSNNLSCKIHPVVPCGRAENTENIDEIHTNYFELLKQLYCRLLDTEKNIEIEPISGILYKILHDRQISECSFAGTCGSEFLSLYTNGDLGLCGRTADTEFFYGSEYTSTLLAAYQSLRADTLRRRQHYLEVHDCKNCNIWEFCHGGCAFEALNFYGDINHSAPGCSLRKMIVAYFYNEGLGLLKQKLLSRKVNLRATLKDTQLLIKDIKNARK